MWLLRDLLNVGYINLIKQGGAVELRLATRVHTRGAGGRQGERGTWRGMVRVGRIIQQVSETHAASKYLGMKNRENSSLNRLDHRASRTDPSKRAVSTAFARRVICRRSNLLHTCVVTGVSTIT